MLSIQRLRPDPMPAIHPLPEYLATGRRAEWYEETKKVLQVPWMGVVTMASPITLPSSANCGGA